MRRTALAFAALAALIPCASGAAPLSGFSGTVIDDVTLAPITFAEVFVWDEIGNPVGSFPVDGTGSYTAAVEPGTYYARTSTAFGPYVDELWDDVSCAFLCVPTDGDPIVVPAATVVSDIDFALAQEGFSGAVTEDGTATPIPFATVDVFDVAGALAGSFIAQEDGTYAAGLPAGTWFARTSTAGTAHVDELWDDLPCPGGSCDPTTGTPIVVPVDGVLAVNFALEVAGFSGVVTDQTSGFPLPLSNIAVFDSAGELVGSFLAGFFGDYLAAVPPGTYHATATAFGAPYVSELHPSTPCPGGFACDPTLGTAIVVSSGSILAGVDFALGQNGFTGTVSDAATTAPLPLAQVSVFESDGDFVTSFTAGFDGSYAAGLPDGSYFAQAAVGADAYVGELYDDEPCPGLFFDPLGDPCDPTTGTPIVVSGVVGGIDFALERSGFTGTVSDLDTAEPVPFTDVLVFDAAGDFVAAFASGLDGAYAAGLPAGSYFARTESALDYLDELWDDQPCPGGACDPTTGDAIAVAAATVVPAIDFVLEPSSADIDGSGLADALTDGVLVLRFLFGFTGSVLTGGDAVDPGCTRCLPEIIEDVLAALEPLFDVDGNGVTTPLTDGVLLLRYLLGIRGDDLIAGAVGPGCTRCLATQIEGYLEGLVG